MTIAELRGKIPGSGRYPVDSSEDLLTSNVFGGMRYIPPGAALIPFLAGARSIEGTPLELTVEFTKVHWSFWPYLNFPDQNSCEPDLVIGLENTDGLTVVVIEVKYLSPKSSLPDNSEHPRDQLARELDCLSALEDPASFLGWSTSAGVTSKALLYLTQDATMPIAAMQESISELKYKRAESNLPSLFWLSWRTLHGILSGSLHLLDNEYYQTVTQDLIDLLEKKSLKTFQGMKEDKFSIPPMELFQYARTAGTYKWKLGLIPDHTSSDYRYASSR